MNGSGGKKLGNLSIEDGGLAGVPRTHADVELERACRAAFYAMQGQGGVSLSKNFRNIAQGRVRPLRVLMKRIRDARRQRSPQSHQQAKAIVRALDRWVDAVHGVQHDTGEFRPAA